MPFPSGVQVHTVRFSSIGPLLEHVCVLFAWSGASLHLESHTCLYSSSLPTCGCLVALHHINFSISNPTDRSLLSPCLISQRHLSHHWLIHFPLPHRVVIRPVIFPSIGIFCPFLYLCLLYGSLPSTTCLDLCKDFFQSSVASFTKASSVLHSVSHPTYCCLSLSWKPMYLAIQDFQWSTLTYHAMSQFCCLPTSCFVFKLCITLDALRRRLQESGESGVENQNSLCKKVDMNMVCLMMFSSPRNSELQTSPALLPAV